MTTSEQTQAQAGQIVDEPGRHEEARGRLTGKIYPARVDAGGQDIADMYIEDVQTLPWDTELVNNRRALWSLDAVAGFGREMESLDKESLRSVLGDLLGNMRHLGSAAGIDVVQMMLDTSSCYQDELNDQYT